MRSSRGRRALSAWRSSVAAGVLGALAFAFAFALASTPSPARAEPRPGDPLAYDLRVALFPVSFQAGMSQSHFGSALRAEYRVLRRLDVGVVARGGLWNVTGEDKHHGYQFGANLSFHVGEELVHDRLAGTVYPENPPALSGPGSRGADRDLDVPVSARLGGPPLGADVDRDATALVYKVSSLRLGFAYVRSVMPAYTLDIEALYVQSALPLLHAGFGWGTHWNLPASVTGRPELGYRRFYVDALATIPAWVDERPLFSTSDAVHEDIFPLGARLGMEGSIDQLLRDAPGVGFGYSIELGALPARKSIEGYLFVGLGLALDFATR